MTQFNELLLIRSEIIVNRYIAHYLTNDNMYLQGQGHNNQNIAQLESFQSVS